MRAFNSQTKLLIALGLIAVVVLAIAAEFAESNRGHHDAAPVTNQIDPTLSAKLASVGPAPSPAAALVKVSGVNLVVGATTTLPPTAAPSHTTSEKTKVTAAPSTTTTTAAKVVATTEPPPVEEETSTTTVVEMPNCDGMNWLQAKKCRAASTNE